MLGRVLSVFCLCACSMQAAASPIPDATYSVTINGAVVGNVPGSYGGPNVSGQLSSFPEPSASATVIGGGQAFAQMIYWFRVDGPTPGAHVPIVITGSLHLSAGGAVFAKDLIWGTTAQLIAHSYDGQLIDSIGGGAQLNEVDYQFATVDCNAGAEGPVPMPPPIATCAVTLQDATVVLHLDTVTGADNQIVMNAAANNQEHFVASFNTVVDPTIAFAPGFDPTGFTISLSEGIGNALPEPAVALLLALTPVAWLRRRVT